MKPFSALIVFATLSTPTTGLAASSDWVQAEGARVRLLTTGKPDATGRLSGALQIDLQPGWKTYWRDPGSSGVPPSIDVSTTPLLAGATFSFPTPQWHTDAGGTWAGYDKPVVLPVDFELRGSGKLDRLEAVVFLGVCQSICVPVQAKLILSPEDGADDPNDAAVIEAARAALPKPATEEFDATIDAVVDKKIIFNVRVPTGMTKIELFVAGENGYMFSPPKPLPSEKGVSYTADIITRPKTKPTGPGIAYTLSAPDSAVSGYLPYF